MRFDSTFLAKLIFQAQNDPKLRTNYTLHNSFEDKVQRMFNALEPATFLPIARHMDSDETLVIISGKLRILIFDDNKNVIDNVIIAQNSADFAYHINKGTWHKVESLEHGTVCFEIREGPYKPLSKQDILG